MRRICASLTLLFVLPALLSAQQIPRALRGFEPWMTRALAAFGVPGAAVAVVRNDSMIYARGFGVRRWGDPAAVDAATIFAIGSASKAFTAAAVGMLVDEGKVRWDDQVSRHLPGFAMYEAYATREMRVRDLLTHRSGLARGDLLWYGSPLDGEEIVRRIRFLRPSSSFRTTFGYQNLMFLAAGQISTRHDGRPWDEVIRDRIFTPLGMGASSTSVRALAGLENVASPHALIDDTLRTVPWRNIDNVAPAGSINSNVLDMARWVRFQLDSGRFEGRRLLSAATWAEAHTPQVVINDPLFRERMGRVTGTTFLTYGLGWFVQDYRGRVLVHHGGNIDGMSALVALVPASRVGVVVLTNLNGNPLPSAVAYEVVDRLLELEPRDWITEVKRVSDGLAALGRETQQRREAARVTGTSPSHDLDAYAGRYVDPDSLYGEVVVSHADGRLTARASEAFTGPLEHWHHDTFRARWNDRMAGRTFLTFGQDADGRIQRVEVEGFGTFTRADRVDTTAAVQLTRADLEAFVGDYALSSPPLTVRVELMDDHLRLTLPGQQAHRLVAESATRFRLTGPAGMPPGFFAVFRVEQGRVVGMILEAPAPRPSLTLERAR